MKGLIIDDRGSNNKVNIEKGAVFINSRITIDGDNNSITLGKAREYFALTINLKGHSKNVKIAESNKNIRSLKIGSIRGARQNLTIGKNFSCGGIEIQMNDGDENCYIGDNCLFSWGIKIRTSDGHSVVDLQSGLATNLPKDVFIGNSVWVGEDVYFNKGAMVSSDSVVASRAVVTSGFTTPNVVIAGFPAKIVKNGVSWDRRMPYEYNASKLDNNYFKKLISENKTGLAFELWLKNTKNVNSKIVSENLHLIEQSDMFQAVINELARERFDFEKPSPFSNLVYRIYRTNKLKFEKYLEAIKKSQEVDLFLAASIGIAESLPRQFIEKLLDTNDKKLILRIFSRLPIHKNNYEILKNKIGIDSIKHNILKLAYEHVEKMKQLPQSQQVVKRPLKIAVCISGQLRGFKQAFEVFKKTSFFNHEVDVFVSVWENKGRKKIHPAHLDRIFPKPFAQVLSNFVTSYGVPRLQEKVPSLFAKLNQVSLVSESELISVYNPKKLLIFNDNEYEGFSNMEKMYFMINQCWNLIEVPEQYDLVVRLRPDKELISCNLDLVSLASEEYANCLVTDADPNIHTDDIYVGDQFAVGSPKVLRAYSEIFSKYSSSKSELFKVEGYRQLLPHSTIFAQMLLQNIDVKPADNQFKWGKLLDSEMLSKAEIIDALKSDLDEGDDFFHKLLEALKQE